MNKFSPFPKPLRFGIRDEIETIIKEYSIDRTAFHEYSKTGYTDIIRKFHYTFCDHGAYISGQIPLSPHLLHFRDSLEMFHIAGYFQSENWADYLKKIKAEVSGEMLFLILEEGWVYEGRTDTIFEVLLETDGALSGFFLISPKFDWCIAHDDVNDFASLYREKL